MTVVNITFFALSCLSLAVTTTAFVSQREGIRRLCQEFERVVQEDTNDLPNTKESLNDHLREPKNVATTNHFVKPTNTEEHLVSKQIRSRPIPGGNWDWKNPLEWKQNFGRRSKEYAETLKTLINLKPGDEGYFHVDHDKCTPRMEADEFDTMNDEELQAVLIGRGHSAKGSRKELLDRIREDVNFAMTVINTSSLDGTKDYSSLTKVPEEAARKDGGALAEYLEEIKGKSIAPSRLVDVKISSLGLEPEKYTAGGAPSVTADVIRKLAGDPFADPPKYGTAFDKFGAEGCIALYSLGAVGSIDTMIVNFLTSLQELVDADSRVHCSLNLNTETGRLSSRRPNMQNQPALEKDKYKIRKAFQSSPGNNLIVAEYGQLELRRLASLTHCGSMIEAFKAGGDFHSRTAMNMFPYIKEKVDNGDVLLEWDYSQGDPPKPLLKDEFASERRKAKTLNFSIAYGKPAHGLSQDWGVSKGEAQDMLDAWYAARKEVEKWQMATKAYARDYGLTRTLMGRYRQLPHARNDNRKLLGHAERASINTPIQGEAKQMLP